MSMLPRSLFIPFILLLRMPLQASAFLILLSMAAARPALAAPRIAPVGELPGDRFGWAVSSAGDHNGDGYDDVIVGAEDASAYYDNFGRAYIYFGGPAANDCADIVFSPCSGPPYGGFPPCPTANRWQDAGGWPASAGHFGYAASGVGDYNADGFDDVVVGAYMDHGGGNGENGRIYVFLGGPAADEFPDFVINGPRLLAHLGVSVAGPGDWNADGFDDFLVGAEGDRDLAGHAYIYYGGPGADGVADKDFVGPAIGGEFGKAVAWAGDVNGDTFDDIIVGEPMNDIPTSNNGRAYVYFGGPGANTSPDLIMIGEAQSHRFGWSTAGPGDLNGDGYDDFVVGTYHTSANKAYVYYGGPGVDSNPDLVLSGPDGTQLYGFTVAAAGDINSDTFSDLAIGDWAYGSGGVFVHYGGLAFDSESDMIVTASQTVQFGRSIGFAGFFDTDSRPDLVVGNPGDNTSGSAAGRAHVLPILPEVCDAGGPYSGPVGQPIDFDGTGSGGTEGTVTDYTWDFGDGSPTASGPTPSHTYTAAGQYTVALTVTYDLTRRPGSCASTGPILRSISTCTTLADVGGASSVLLPGDMPAPPHLVLSEGRPNPFRPTTAIDFGLPADGRVTLSIYDTRGRLVRTLVDAQLERGSHSARWNGRTDGGDAAVSGVYFVQLRFGESLLTHKLLLTK